MKQTVLIPTDFSIESLLLVKHAATANPASRLDIVLLYCHYLSDSITDILFYSPRKTLEELISSDFREACSIIQNKYPSKITHMRVEVFYGHTGGAFDNFIEAHKIDEAYIPSNYTLRLGKNGFDPLPYIKGSGLKINEVCWEAKKNRPEKDQLAELFLD